MEDRISGLTCNHLPCPTGLDSVPAFSWKYTLRAGRGRQTAYQITVDQAGAELSQGQTRCWDSGVVTSSQSHFIEYAGTPLSPRTRYQWTVTVHDEGGAGHCAQSSFETGKRDERWVARWISAFAHRKQDDALDAPYLRKTFALAARPVSARLYICSPGYFDARINGQAVTDQVLTTPFTKFDSRLLYCTYDVTELLEHGDNAIGATIGNGWYNCFTEDPWNSRQATWRHLPKLIAELHVTLADGETQLICTDGSWKSSPGPVTFNGIRNGEHYDARRALPGWSGTGVDDSQWDPVRVTRPPGGVLKAMEMEPIRITARMEPVSSWQTPEQTHVFDVGQNMAGVAEVAVDGAAGDEIVVRYSEQLADDGIQVDQGTVSGFVKSGEFQTDRYIKGTDATETWRPTFVYHGFQYIEVAGCTRPPRVQALVLHTDVASSGSFSCADDTLNKLQHAACWATVSNLHSIPTDDPHREKNAWTGDVALSAEQMLYNYHTAPLLRKWLTDIRDSQRPDGGLPCVVPSTGWGYNWGNGPDWSSALTLIPWQIYVHTGDRRVLHENYEAITRHFGYMESMAEDLLVSYGIGDWCPPFEGRAISVSMSSFKTPVALTDTAYFYQAADLIARMGGVLGRRQDELHYSRAAAQIKQAFRSAFYDPSTHAVAGDCQTSTACMIHQGLINDDELGPLLDVLVKQIADSGYHQDTGILGSKYLYNVLGEAGKMDLALKMVLNGTYPSFRHWIDRGATTLWECWNGEGSRNHHMFSDISAVMCKYLGGIRPDESEPGFRHILMKPAVDCGLPSVRCSHESPFGTIVSQWQRGDGYVDMEIQIPGGSRATLGLPACCAAQDYPAELLPGEHRFRVQAD
jgi:alpha-L-rhamnosidase